METNLKMKVLTLLLFLSSTLCFGIKPEFPTAHLMPETNLPPKIKRVLTYHDSILLIINEYDICQRKIFTYNRQDFNSRNKNKFLTMIIGNEYDNAGTLIKSYNLHSNVGISIRYYDFDDTTNCIKVYEKNNRYEDIGPINENQYSYLSEIKSYDDLIHFPKIPEIETKNDKLLLCEERTDTINNIIEKSWIDSRGDTDMIQKFEFNKDQNVINYFQELPQHGIYHKIYYEYEKDPIELFGRKPTKNSSHKLLQSVRFSFNSDTKKEKVDEITFYKYDSIDRLKEEVTFTDGVFETKALYEYDDKNRLKSQTLYKYDDTKIAKIMTYQYNNEGYVIKKTETDNRSKKSRILDYKYVYEYYK